jgi:hypothetical protein
MATLATTSTGRPSSAGREILAWTLHESHYSLVAPVLTAYPMISSFCSGPSASRVHRRREPSRIGRPPGRCGTSPQVAPPLKVILSVNDEANGMTGHPSPVFRGHRIVLPPCHHRRPDLRSSVPQVGTPHLVEARIESGILDPWRRHPPKRSHRAPRLRGQVRAVLSVDAAELLADRLAFNGGESMKAC